jgi:hypothetical protein
MTSGAVSRRSDAPRERPDADAFRDRWFLWELGGVCGESFFVDPFTKRS